MPGPHAQADTFSSKLATGTRISSHFLPGAENKGHHSGHLVPCYPEAILLCIRVSPRKPPWKGGGCSQPCPRLQGWRPHTWGQGVQLLCPRAWLTLLGSGRQDKVARGIYVCPPTWGLVRRASLLCPYPLSQPPTPLPCRCCPAHRRPPLPGCRRLQPLPESGRPGFPTLASLVLLARGRAQQSPLGGFAHSVQGST